MNPFTTSQRQKRWSGFLFSFAGYHLQQLSGAAPDHHFWFSYHLGRIQLSVYLPRHRSDGADFRRAAGTTHYPGGDGPGAADLLWHLVPVLYGRVAGFAALTHFNLFVARIAAASFMAYALGQILDVHVFNRLRQNRRWWLAPTASTLFGNVSDTGLFFIAFWRSPDPFMAANWGEIAIVDYSFKVLISIVFFLPMYGMLLNMLLKNWQINLIYPHCSRLRVLAG